MMQWWIGAFLVLLAAGLGYYIRLIIGRYKIQSGEQEAKRLLDEARREVDGTRKEAGIQAKAEVLKAREAFEHETKSRRQEMAALEARMAERELNLDRKVAMIDKKNLAIEQKLAEVEKKEVELNQQRDEYNALIKTEREKLQRIAGMTLEEARRALMARIEEEVRGETGMLIRRLQEEAKENAERAAKKIVALAIQRFSSGHVSEIMTSTIALPSEDMKGRIIGREGRNIRALEAATGVDLLVDDTPEAVVISAFDPLRREIAKQTLERLIVDGRIHPARIEEVVAKVKEEMAEVIRAAGEEAIYAVGLQGVEPEMVRTLGRLKYRNSYAQNVLMHSIEVAQLMGIMAGELGLDVMLAKRTGLFHDIGKALDSEVEGSHAIIGADFLRRQGETQVLLNAVAAHHSDVEPESIYAILAAAADAISASRPGARSENTAIYVKRLEQLEALASGFSGIEKCYAIQAGREVRIIVQPEKVDDAGAMHLARDISKKIEQDLQYPGQIKVTVIREKRCVEYAR
ncbi:MAG: ribonuclease Y [Kiritimatiellae bacterium]|nr:ribonuclease Y [Kiritimatiellia bacterium]